MSNRLHLQVQEPSGISPFYACIPLTLEICDHNIHTAVFTQSRGAHIPLAHLILHTVINFIIFTHLSAARVLGSASLLTLYVIRICNNLS
jgi:hypothetical protein